MWNTAEVVKTLGPGSVLVSIVRDPVEVFESMWRYYKFGEDTGMSLDTLADNIARGQRIDRW